MCGSAAHWDFASQNKEDKSSPRREGLGFCFAKQGGLYGKRN